MYNLTNPFKLILPVEQPYDGSGEGKVKREGAEREERRGDEK